MAASTSSSIKPTECTTDYWIYCKGPERLAERGEIYGKWLIFRKPSQMDELWEDVSARVISGELLSPAAKVSTMIDHKPTSTGKDMVICVYTTKEDIDVVGMKLVHVVKQTIRYKTDEATLAGAYTAHGHKKTTIKTINWNKGEPYIKE